jgi:hypothetical protein
MRPQPALLALTVAVEVQLSGPAGPAWLGEIVITASAAAASHASHRLVTASPLTNPCKLIDAPFFSIESIAPDGAVFDLDQLTTTLKV